MDSNTKRMHYSTLLHTYIVYNKLATYCKKKRSIPNGPFSHTCSWSHYRDLLTTITIATCTYFLHATPNYGMIRGDRGSLVVAATKIVRNWFRNSTCGESTPCYMYTSSFVQRESLENVNTSLRILTALAEDCPEETLLRSVNIV
jgi:hypothetical protein